MSTLSCVPLAPGGKTGKPACVAMQPRRLTKTCLPEVASMFKKFLSLGRRPNREVTDALYGEIVASARQPAFYATLNVPDTPIGRFEMLSLHMFLFLERVRGGGEAVSAVAQDLADEFFKDVEHSLRELGIGDMGVPKRMKKLAKMFYGRAEAYRQAIVDGDRVALAAALSRNVWPGEPERPEALALADHARGALAALASQSEADFLRGEIRFPVPLAEGGQP